MHNPPQSHQQILTIITQSITILSISLYLSLCFLFLQSSIYLILILVNFELAENFKFIYYFVCFRGYDVFIVYFEGVSFVCWVSMECHDAHPRNVISCKRTEVLRPVVLFDDPVVDPSNCFNKVSQSSPIVRSSFVDKLVINKGPNPFILMHMRPIVQINESLAFKLSWYVFI